ncbi:hypothetical protein BC833DRAFT_574215 [Globomyces pollinis-pini]|nr:hypothetical protein BC833DRAFT_574215 [Globomyces pollinis-pini]
MSYLVLFEELNKDLSQIMLLTKLYPHHALFSHPGKLNGNEIQEQFSKDSEIELTESDLMSALTIHFKYLLLNRLSNIIFLLPNSLLNSTSIKLLKVCLGKVFIQFNENTKINCYFIHHSSIDLKLKAGKIVPNLNLITMTLESLSDPFTVDQLNMTASIEPKLKRSRVNSIGQEKPNKRVAVDSSGHSTVEEVNPKIQRSYLICDPTVTAEGPVYPKDSFGWFVEKKLYDSTPTPEFYGRIHGLN